MTTTDKNGNLAIAVCPDCNSHSVCDSAWLGMEGQTLKLPCDNCVDGSVKDHLVIIYGYVGATREERLTISKCRAAWRWLRCLVRHPWEYTPAEYFDEELALEKGRATRTCKRCGKSEIRERHCLGLNPPEYHDHWHPLSNTEIAHSEQTD